MQIPLNFKRFSPKSSVEKNASGSGVFLQCTRVHWRKTPDPLAFFSTLLFGENRLKFSGICIPHNENLRSRVEGGEKVNYLGNS
jgi:hypothetical protein